MTNTEAPAHLSVEHLLRAVKGLSPADLERFAREFTDWRAAGTTEADLLARVLANSRLPEPEYQRLEMLRHRHGADGLTPEEEAELQGLWVRVEEISAARLEALVELSRRRGSSVQKLVRELHLDEDLDAA